MLAETTESNLTELLLLSIGSANGIRVISGYFPTPHDSRISKYQQPVIHSDGERQRWHSVRLDHRLMGLLDYTRETVSLDGVWGTIPDQFSLFQGRPRRDSLVFLNTLEGERLS